MRFSEWADVLLWVSNAGSQSRWWSLWEAWQREEGRSGGVRRLCDTADTQQPTKGETMKAGMISIVVVAAALSAWSAAAGGSLQSSARARSGFALVVLGGKQSAMSSSSRDTRSRAADERVPLRWHNPSRPLIHAPPVVAR